MESLSRIRCFTTSSNFPFPRISPIPRSTLPTLSVLRTSPRPVSGAAEEDVLQMFFKERKLSGDIISKASDIFWQREVKQFVDADANAVKPADTPQQAEQVMVSDSDGGFLKLSRTYEWVSGENSAPVNKKAIAKALRDDSERRKKLNLLQYEAIKREMMLLSVGIGTACSGYCLIVLSVQAAISYATGVLFSCLYLQLLYQQVDNLSREFVPQVFMQKKSKKIGIRSEDLTDAIEKSIKGSGFALSSPRLVIPAAIYGLWILSHQYFANDLFDFQLVPAMLGMFVYKAAALVQVYRDNEDLQLVFPESGND
ncbi:NF-kappa-B inhibitor-like protein 2 isoform 1 [Fagus crenata]